MIKLDRPTYEAGAVFTTCISRIRNPQLKARLEGVLQVVIDASAEFEDMVGNLVTQAEMEAVYTDRMAKKGAPGRDIYDALITSAPRDRCPLCAHRTVSTLDHHLPKAHFPALAVAPLNLVPACADCNKTKLAVLPGNANEETLHPYFDDIDNDRWLVAEVIQEQPAALRFFVEGPDHWNDVLQARVEGHFRTFDLGTLYSSEAADELECIRHQLRSMYNAGGIELVRTELRDRAESCQYARRNGWRTATYRALADSEWFCDGGFEE